MSANPQFVALGSAARQLALRPQRHEDRRRFRRLPVSLNGRMMTAAQQECDCRTLDVSPGDLRITGQRPVTLGEPVVLYVKELGRLQGRVARIIAPQEFALVIEASVRKREKLAEALTVLANPTAANMAEDRRGRRAVSGGDVQVILEDGTALAAEIIDFSLVGVSVRTARRPEIGAWVSVGAVFGRVARYTETGFAIDFESKAR